MRIISVTLLKTVLIFGFFILFSAAEVIGATFYVATNGRNSNIGTRNAPWASIQYAYSQVEAGDTIIVKDGVYKEAATSNKMVQISKSGSGTSGKWITFKAENKWGAVLDGSSLGEETYYGFFIGNGAKYIRFEDFEIRNVVSGFRTNATVEGETHHIYVYRCKIHDVDFAGVNNTGYTDYFTVDSCVIYNIRKAEDRDGRHQYFHNHGLYLKGKHNLVINNIIYEPQGGSALRIDGYNGTKMTGDDWSFKVINNVFHGTSHYSEASGLIGFFRAKAAEHPPHGVIIENNLFIDPPDGMSGVKAIAPGEAGNNCDNPLSHWTPSKTEINNNVTNVGILLKDCLSSLIKSYSNNVINARDINLNRIDNHDYRPTSSSSDLIDKGSCKNSPKYDFARNQRPSGSACDVGAYEFVDEVVADQPEPPSNLKIIQ